MVSSAAPTPCPACGVAGVGAFCTACGAARAERFCAACGAAIPVGGRFCAACGAAAAARAAGPGAGASAGAPPAASGPAPLSGWLVMGLGVVLVGAVLALVWPRGPRPTAPGGTAPAGVPTTGGGDPSAIDLSTMTPREQFDRLYNRVMRAAEAGDDQTVTQFAPMALGAYAQLLPGDVDADARYHAAMIRLHTDDLAGAAALADTIRAEVPSHLFSYVIHGTLARQRGDAARLAEEQRGFLGHYDAEMAAGRDEYGHHDFIITQFVGEARAAAGGN